MSKRLLMVSATLLLFGCLAWAGGQSWTGVVSDSHCGAKHGKASDASVGCINKCVEGGAKYVLVAGEKVYQLDAQDKFKSFAGKSVKVTGTVKGDAITVESVEAAM